MAKRKKAEEEEAKAVLASLLTNVFEFVEKQKLWEAKQRLTHGVNHALLTMFSQAVKHPLNEQDFLIATSGNISWDPFKISFRPTKENFFLSEERIGVFFEKLRKALETSSKADQITILTPTEKPYPNSCYEIITSDPLAMICLIETYLANEELMTLDNLKMYLSLSGHDTFDSLADKFRLSSENSEKARKNSFIALPSVPFASPNQAFVTGGIAYHNAINHSELLGFSLENLKAKAVRAVGSQIEAGSPYQLH